PGSSIKEVYEDAKEEYIEAEDFGRDVWNQAAGVMVQKDSANHTWTVFNSAPWERNDLVFIPGISSSKADVWVDHAGNNLRFQAGDNGSYVQVKDLPAMGY